MKKLVNIEDLINWWLEKYHNTNLEKVKKEHPEWEKNPEQHTRDFYTTYMVTQKQHDEWEAWAKNYTKKVTGVSKPIVDRGWWKIYLNASPKITKTKE